MFCAEMKVHVVKFLLISDLQETHKSPSIFQKPDSTQNAPEGFQAFRGVSNDCNQACVRF